MKITTRSNAVGWLISLLGLASWLFGCLMALYQLVDLWNGVIFCEISCSEGEFESGCLLGCWAVWSGRN
jgi:hypothetical protein